jgi:hypothetical protein
LPFLLLDFDDHRIPRQTIPINENTGKINIEFHQAILDAIDEREKQDLINDDIDNIDNDIDIDYDIDKSSSSQKVQDYHLDNSNYNVMSDQQQHQQQQKQLNNEAIKESLWMSLTASINTVSTSSTTNTNSTSNMSFSLFPELLKDDNDMLTSFLNDDDDDDDGGGGGSGSILTDIKIMNNENNGIMATAAAATTIPITSMAMSSIYPDGINHANTTADNYYYDDNTDDVRINDDGIIEVLRPKSNDIIMGKG